MSNNLLEELKYKIAQYEEQVRALTQTVNQKNMELNNISIKMSEVRSRLEMKKTDVNRIQNKINEKSKIANEARMAYNKILDNTSKLLQAVNNENSFNGDWGLGIGDWGLGIGPNPQSPIPHPQSPFNI